MCTRSPLLLLLPVLLLLLSRKLGLLGQMLPPLIPWCCCSR
jgi:hypothetical protein